MTGVQTCALPICFPVTIAEVAQRTKHYVGDVVKPLMKEWDHTKNLQKNLDQIVRKIQLRPENWTRDQLVVAIDHAAKESQSIKGQDDTHEEEPVQKFRVEEGRDIYGRKIA